MGVRQQALRSAVAKGSKAEVLTLIESNRMKR